MCLTAFTDSGIRGGSRYTLLLVVPFRPFSLPSLLGLPGFSQDAQ